VSATEKDTRFPRIPKAARTLADLVGSEQIATAHLSEAISYRRMERE
jgi:magnesium chelatase family protein